MLSLNFKFHLQALQEHNLSPQQAHAQLKSFWAEYGFKPKSSDSFCFVSHVNNHAIPIVAFQKSVIAMPWLKACLTDADMNFTKIIDETESLLAAVR